MAELAVPGLLPRFSMMSSSPQLGQPAVPIFDPSIQNAGHSPLPEGSAIRASIRPYRISRLPCVLRRVEVYWQVPYHHEPVVVRRAVRVRMPPDTAAFCPFV